MNDFLKRVVAQREREQARVKEFGEVMEEARTESRASAFMDAARALTVRPNVVETSAACWVCGKPGGRARCDAHRDLTLKQMRKLLRSKN